MRPRHPTREQLLHLVGHADHRALTPAEAALLRSAVNRLLPSAVSVGHMDETPLAADPAYLTQLRAEVRTWGTPGTGEVLDAAEAVLRSRLVTARRQQAHLLGWLAALNSSVVAPDGDHPGTLVLYLIAGGWQMRWRIAPEDADLFDHVELVAPHDPRARWDGHSEEQTLLRIRSHAAVLADDSSSATAPPTAPAAASSSTEPGTAAAPNLCC